MLDRLRDVSQTAMSTGERALRLFWDLLSVASERLREVAGQPKPLPVEPSPPPGPRPAAPRPAAPAPATAAPATPAAPAVEAAPAAPAPAPAKAEGKPAAKAKSKAKTKKTKTKSSKKPAQAGRPDQMIRVLELLAETGKEWVSAKELSDAGGASGTPILPGNVRKVIRARGEGLVDTRDRDGSRRGALEYRLTDAGREKLKG